MKSIFILGSGGFAKEVWFLIQEINAVSPSYIFEGFIDRHESTSFVSVGSKKLAVFTKRKIEESVKDGRHVCIVNGIGAPDVIARAVSEMPMVDFPNLIHPNFVYDKASCEMGIGNIVTSGCVFTVNIKIGSHNIFNLNSTVGHDTVIGNYNVINPGVNISGGVNVGNGNLVGTGSAILQNLTIGDHSILGAGAVLTKNLDSKCMAVGVPAKVVKSL